MRLVPFSTGMDPDPGYIIWISGSQSGSSKAKMVLKKAKLKTIHALKNYTYSLEDWSLYSWSQQVLLGGPRII